MRHLGVVLILLGVGILTFGLVGLDATGLAMTTKEWAQHNLEVRITIALGAVLLTAGILQQYRK